MSGPVPARSRVAPADRDIARLLSGTGGWGDPKARPRALVRADLRAGLVTEEVARRVYGLTDQELLER